MLQKLDIQKEKELLEDIVIGKLKRIRRRITESIEKPVQGIEILKQLRIYEYDYINQYQHRALVLEAGDWLNQKYLTDYDCYWESLNENKIFVSKLIGTDPKGSKVELLVLNSPGHIKVISDYLKNILKKFISESITENRFCFVNSQFEFMHVCNIVFKMNHRINVIDLKSNEEKRYM